MKLKKVLCVIMSSLMLVCSSVAVLANEPIVTVNNGPTITPFDAQFIDNTHHIGKSAFEKTFTASPSNGKTLNVYVDNRTSGTGDIEITVSWGSGSTYTKTWTNDISKGSSPTFKYTMEDGSGISGNWKVYITNSDGKQMDIYVSARQF